MSELMIDLIGPGAHLFYLEFGREPTHAIIPDHEGPLRPGVRTVVRLLRPSDYVRHMEKWHPDDLALPRMDAYEIRVGTYHIDLNAKGVPEPFLGLLASIEGPSEKTTWQIYTARTVAYARKAGVLR